MCNDFLHVKKEMFRNFYIYTYAFTILSIMLKLLKIMPNMNHLNGYYESNFKDELFIYYCLHPLYVLFKYIKRYIDNTDTFLRKKIGKQLIGMYIEQGYKFTLNAMFFVILYNVCEIVFNCRNSSSKPFSYYVFTILVPSAILFLVNFGITMYTKKKKVVPLEDETIFKIITYSFYAIFSFCVYWYFLKKYALESDSSSESGNIMKMIKKLRIKEYLKVLFIHIVVSGFFVIGFRLKPDNLTSNLFATHKVMVVSNVITFIMLYKYVFR